MSKRKPKFAVYVEGDLVVHKVGGGVFAATRTIAAYGDSAKAATDNLGLYKHTLKRKQKEEQHDTQTV